MSFIQKSIQSGAPGYPPEAPTRWGDVFWMRCYRTDDRPASATGSRGKRGVTTGDEHTTTLRMSGWEKAPPRTRLGHSRAKGASISAESGKFSSL